ncbi:oligosaccharide flippase family protein [Zunongwangia sp.]|uniref:oligosaccharide flippase family protein n=1 Tax=Zunongwangia sp. TaxID=1965325 RepID=UPI003AA9AFAC
MKITLSQLKIRKITPEQFFMLSAMAVNGGNYLYNLLLGRILGPQQFANAAILITFLLVLSFVAMTFQLSVAKFTAGYETHKQLHFLNYVKKASLLIGIVASLAVVIFAGQLQQVFHTDSKWMFIIFGLGIPVYFLMSVNRGFYQGNKSFYKLSVTYQAEMFSRLFITILLVVLLTTNNSSNLVALGILISFIFGLMPFKNSGKLFSNKIELEASEVKNLVHFIAITAFYEFTQIIINNSDILLVKHYFPSYEAGLYASLALIGRLVYFVAWMFVMILLPTVVQRKKRGEDTLPVLFRYIGFVCILAATIIGLTYFFPEFIINIMFGEAYVSMASLLWKYALATSLFAISNVFVYYFLSLDKYWPVALSGVFGIAQVVSILLFHESLAQVVNVQISIMLGLLGVQLVYFFYQHKSKTRLK